MFISLSPRLNYTVRWYYETFPKVTLHESPKGAGLSDATLFCTPLHAMKGILYMFVCAPRGRSYNKCRTDGVDQRTASMHMSITYSRTCIYNKKGQSAYVRIGSRWREACSNNALRNADILLVMCCKGILSAMLTEIVKCKEQLRGETEWNGEVK